MPDHPLHEPVLAWYVRAQRDLPWRRADASAWSVLVSEVMLAQTPVARVLPAHETWVTRWPTPADLAADAPGDAVRSWGRLGYPRRALWLHAAATAIVAEHDGEVPDDEAALRRLPGVGDYTAAAVAAFAFGRRTAVLDTNVRRVLARVLAGRARPGPSVTVAERAGATALLPDDDRRAATWSVAVMELGALVCRATGPRCETCPVRDRCSWRASGHPPDERPRRTQRWAGTDRQCRGALLELVRDSAGPVGSPALARVWPDDAQRRRCLDSLVADGLLEPLPRGRFALPATVGAPESRSVGTGVPSWEQEAG